ncbi:TOMM precursor leader peptide-binding protein [Nonomuraea sp. MG754425]|uniref:TOMM precursor leader peptide-binding protein n=1 Tax=Nonomuraea sp. MG754425 TaxID=2570319 RepID=UPI001F371A4D|nr:TOMM precursor leader peptide-binding protein [Nonomuraea sp. MG754425]MCF6473555.1 TOMM precursor leader peptide-binding protein [Nonomuraea sp. MG754425]
MATTVRLIRPASVGVGPFGERVADILSSQFEHGRMARDVASAFSSNVDAVVLSLWRPWPALCETADRSAYERGIPWLPVVVEHPYAIIGPWIAPPAGPCFACYSRRRDQHDEDWQATRAMRAAYDEDPECGPAGFLPQHARLVAGIAARSVSRKQAGVVTAISLRTHVMTTYPIVPIHGCPRCGRETRRPGLRQLLRLDEKERADAG